MLQLNHLSLHKAPSRTGYTFHGEQIMNNLNKNLQKSQKRTNQVISQIGNKLEQAQTDYYNAVASGKQDRVLKAQHNYQNLQLIMQTLTEFVRNKFLMMSRIVQNIRN